MSTLLKRFLVTLSGGNSQKDWKFLDHAREGRLSRDLIEHHLHIRGDINAITLKYPGYEGYTALMHYVGCWNADPEVVEHLIARGANVRLQSKHGHTALSSVPYGSKDSSVRSRIYRLLLDRGADPNSMDSVGYTPLHNAVGCCEPEEVTLLLDSGARASINRCGRKVIGNPYWGYAPIHKAISETRSFHPGRVRVIKLLVDSGADTNLPANSSRYRPVTPLFLLTESLEEAERGLIAARQDGGSNTVFYESWLRELEAVKSYFDEIGVA